MGEQIPVNKEILRWARETHGFSIEDLEKPFPKLALWESKNHKDCPTYSQLEQLALRYKRPLAIFFFPDPPAEESIKKSLRSVSERDFESLSPTMHHIFRKAKAFQISLRELYQSDESEQKKRISWLPELDTSTAIVNLAGKVRDIFGVTSEEQESWKHSEKAFKKWRSVLSDNGLYVFKEAFKTDKIAGFCMYDQLFPIIFINNTNQSVNRQIFTLFHELGHLVYKNSYLDVIENRTWEHESPDTQNIEVKCNKFANYVLIPEEHFKENFLSSKPIKFSDSYIGRIAHEYCVSREVVLRRLLDRKCISPQFYKSKVEEWNSQYLAEKKKANKKSGGHYDNTKMSYLGDAYLSLVLNRYYGGSITLDQASSYLDIPTKSFNRIEDSFLQRKGV